jgi:endo-1,4-beta-mannosidase
MGLKLAGIMLILMMAMGGLGYWYYNDTQKAAIDQQKKDMKLSSDVANKAMKQFHEARKQIDVMSKKFNKVSKLLGARDIGKIAVAKPGPIKKIINKGSNKMMRCFEILSGQPLTDKEKNAEKKSQINTMCPNVANPNYAPSQ